MQAKRNVTESTLPPMGTSSEAVQLETGVPEEGERSAYDVINSMYGYVGSFTNDEKGLGEEPPLLGIANATEETIN